MLFKTIADQLNEGESLTLTIFKIGDKLTVGVIPRISASASQDVKDAFGKIQPMALTDTPEKLDFSFITELLNPLNEAMSRFSTVASGIKSIDKATNAISKGSSAKNATKSLASAKKAVEDEAGEEEQHALSLHEGSPVAPVGVVQNIARPPAPTPPRPGFAPTPPRPAAPQAPKPAMSPAKYNSLMDKMKIGGQNVIEAQKLAMGFAMTHEQAAGLAEQAEKYRVTGAGGQTQL